MKNKKLLTSFLPMLVTAALLIVAPMAREAFYTYPPPDKNIVTNSLSPDLSISRIEINRAIQVLSNNDHSKQTLKYTGDQFPGRYKEGVFSIANNSLTFRSLINGKASDHAETIAKNLTPPAGSTNNDLALVQGTDGYLYITGRNAELLYRVTYKK